MRVRDARPDERVTVRSILDAAMLEVPDLNDRTVLVAAEADRVLGALVLDGAHVEGVAVRPGRRGQGIGRALVEAAANRRERLTAAFDERVVPFYRALGFDIGDGDGEGRYRGRLR